MILLGQIDTIIRCESALASIMDEMTDDDWATLCQMVLSLAAIARRSAPKEEPVRPISPTFESIRFSYLIALRDPDRFGQAVFFKFFKSYSGTAQDYLEFRQGQALACAANNAFNWNEALAIIKEDYARGITTEPDYPVLNSLNAIVPEVYSQILANSEQYPVALCDAAQAAASRVARRSVKPVSAIARTERWFAFD